MSSRKSMFNNGDRLEMCEINDDFALMYKHYELLCKNRFKWGNLPNGIESRHIEKGLFTHGMVAFFKDPTKGLMCLPCKPSTGLNPYGDPLKYNIIGYGDYANKEMLAEDIVVIRENDIALPMSVYIANYALKMSETEKTLMQNLRQQRKPYIIATTENNKLSMKNMYEKIDEGKDAIYVDKRKSEGGNIGIDVLQTKSEFLVDKLSLHEDKIESKLLSLLGLNNANTNKKERLITDEVNANNSNILMNLDFAYKNRELAKNQINKKFSQNITLEKTIDQLDITFTGDDKEINDRKKMD